MAYFLAIQLLLIVFSFAGALVKVASGYWATNGFWSAEVLSALTLSATLMLVYAFFWQKILKRLPLSQAYLNNTLMIFWGLLWAVVLFKESIGFFNILGAAMIAGGLILVNKK